MKTAHVVFLILSIMFSVCVFGGCSEGREFIERFKPSDADIDNLVDPHRINDGSEKIEEYKEYFDEKTGEYVTKRQYSANKASDVFSSTGGVILSWVLLVGGILLHRMENATMKKWGRGLVLLFMLYWGIRYLLAYGADRL